jgi:hypothetical protein
VVTNLISVSVAGNFVLASPSGSVTLTVSQGSTGTGGVGGSTAPIPVIGAVQQLLGASTLPLDGSGSSNPSGGGLLYSWTVSGPSPVVIRGSNEAMAVAQFTVPGNYTLVLTVTNGAGISSTATVAIQYVGGF